MVSVRQLCGNVGARVSMPKFNTSILCVCVCLWNGDTDRQAWSYHREEPYNPDSTLSEVHTLGGVEVQYNMENKGKFI